MKNILTLLAAIALVSFVSCVNDPLGSDEQSQNGQELAVATLQEQIASIDASLKLAGAVEGLDEAEASMKGHLGFLENASWYEGTLATMALQEDLAAMIAEIKSEDKELLTFSASIGTWLGEDFEEYYTVLLKGVSMVSSAGRIDVTTTDHILSVEGLMSDVEAGLREETELVGLSSLEVSVRKNDEDIAELKSGLVEMMSGLESACVSAIEAGLGVNEESDVEDFIGQCKAVSASLASVDPTLDDLIGRVQECEAALEEILERLDGVEQEVEGLLGMIQSVTFVPEYATGNAVAYYEMLDVRNSEGLCQREPVETIDLTFMVRPASVASALTEDVVDVFGYYAQSLKLSSVATSDYINFEIADVKVINAARGLVSVSVNHDLKEDFYFKKTGAKLCLSVVTGKTDITSAFVDLVPKDISSKVYVEAVELSDRYVEIKNGEKFKLTAVVKPTDATVNTCGWVSSNSKVVEVASDGTLTAVGVGSAVVTATSVGTDEWGLPVTASCEVTVHEAIKLAGPAYVEMGKTAEIQLDYPSGLIVENKTWWIETKTSGPTGSVKDGVVTPASYYYNAETKAYETFVVKCQVNETVVSHELMVVAEQPKAVKIAALADNVNNAVIKLGSTLDLSASIYPASVESGGLFRIQYVSDSQNLNVAEINFSTGLVTSKSPGSAYMNIDIYSKEGGYYFAPGHDVLRRTVRVDVEPYWVKSITFAQTSYELAPDASMAADAVFTSDVDGVQPSYKDLTWTSSNTSVASVNEQTGVVTAIAEGTAVITATASNEWAVKEGEPSVSASYTVTVKKPAKAIYVGDYYYSDGDWSTERDYSKTVVGIVFAVGNYAASDAHLLADKSTCSNGLVIGLKESSTRWAADDGWSKKDAGNWLVNNGYSNIASKDKVSGYGNTKGLKALNAANVQSYGCTIDVALPDVSSSYTPSAPAASSGWYLPSYQEMKILYENLSTINTKLTSAGGTAINTSGRYFTSTLYESWGSYYFYGFAMSTGDWHSSVSLVSDEYPVRTVLAF